MGKAAAGASGKRQKHSKSGGGGGGGGGGSSQQRQKQKQHPHNAVITKRATFKLDLHPSAVADAATGARALLDGMLMRHHDQLGGVLMSYAHDKIVGTDARIVAMAGRDWTILPSHALDWVSPFSHIHTAPRRTAHAHLYPVFPAFCALVGFTTRACQPPTSSARAISRLISNLCKKNIFAAVRRASS